MRTALVRNENGLKIIRDDYYTSNKEMACDLRGNGFKVLKIWSGDISDPEVQEWEFLNRTSKAEKKLIREKLGY